MSSSSIDRRLDEMDEHLDTLTDSILDLTDMLETIDKQINAHKRAMSNIVESQRKVIAACRILEKKINQPTVAVGPHPEDEA